MDNQEWLASMVGAFSKLARDVERSGEHGRFLGCSGFPRRRHTRNAYGAGENKSCLTPK